MSGPSLRKLDAHHSIHEGSFTEAKQLTDVLYQLVSEKRDKEAKEAADALIEHWEQRILAHADSEEEGFYPEVLKKKPEMKETLAQLTRDHNLLRAIAKDVRKQLAGGEITKEVLDRFTSLLLVNEIHSRDEERLLLGEEHEHAG